MMWTGGRKKERRNGRKSKSKEKEKKKKKIEKIKKNLPKHF